MPFDDKNPWSPWVSLYYPGTFAHPDAPAGGTGAGYSRPPGPSGIDIHGGRGAPDPHSPEGHKITPWEAAAEYAKFELERAKNGICDAGSWESLCRVAERALGPQSFGLGACYGILKNPTMSVVGLVQLQKMLIEADLYDRLNRRVSWKTLLSPGWMTGLPQLYEVGFHLARYAGVISMDDLKRSYELREALIKNVGEIFAHPVDSLGNMAGKIKDDYAKKWNRFLELQKQTDLKSQFEAGEIFGDVLMEVVMLVLTVISVGAAAAKLAAKVPQLVRIAEFFRGARAAEVGGAATEAGEAATEAKSAAKAVEAVPKDEVELPVADAVPAKTTWPPNRGFKYSEPKTLQPNDVIDRFGGDTGTFASPQGTPLSARSLPPGSETRPLNVYKVMKPIEVDAGPVAPWFGQPGGGTQYELPATIKELVASGHLKPI